MHLGRAVRLSVMLSPVCDCSSELVGRSALFLRILPPDLTRTKSGSKQIPRSKWLREAAYASFAYIF